MEPIVKKHHHHILPVRVAVLIGGILLFLTAVTVWISHIDLGRLNFFVAMAVASFKACLVGLFFMNLKYDRRENGMIFVTSFLFLAIFIVLAATDLFFRGDVYVKGPLMAATSGGSTLKKPWVSTPQLVAKGKELFAVQCVSCHGAEGKGDGPAAAALNPHPRNFSVAEGWKNGRKPTMVFKTLKEGLPPSAMASYATLPSDDRWALVHYVLSLAPNPEADTSADFAKIGVDPTKENGGGATEAPTLSTGFAMRRVMADARQGERPASLYHSGLKGPSGEASMPAGMKIYQDKCIECHNLKGQGGIKVQNLGVDPIAYVTTAAFNSQTDGLKSQESFNQVVIRGLPGNLMPGFGQYSQSELQDLYRYVKSLAGSNQ